MVYAATPEEIASRRNAFIRKWRLRHRAVADSLEVAGDRLFTFTRLPPTQWRSARTTNAIERLHEEFKRRIKPRPCYRQPILLRCCSGRCSPQGRSTCGKSTVGRRSPRSRHAEFQHIKRRHQPAWTQSLLRLAGYFLAL